MHAPGRSLVACTRARMHLLPCVRVQTILSRAEAIAIRTSAEFVGLALPEHWTKEPAKYAQELRAAEKKVCARACPAR